MADSIRVFAPATVANVGAAFDVLGFALGYPGDEVCLQRNSLGKIQIRSIVGDGGKLSLDPNLNTAGVALREFCHHTGIDSGWDLDLVKNMPLGSGLGSSAASAVAALFAVNEIQGRPLSSGELLPFAMQAEKVACGSAHADNVAPSLLGGFVLIPSYEPLQFRQLPAPEGLKAVVVHPHIEVRTRDARDVLRQKVNLRDAASQWGRVGGLVTALFTNDWDLLSLSLEDRIVEPVRARLIPGFYSVRQAALDAGALGGSISGSGPSVFALCHPDQDAGRIASAMMEAFLRIGIASDVFVSEINRHGPLVLD